MNTLQDIFVTILNMSITASFAVVGVILVRFLLEKAPKIFSYILWAPVLFRLVCPFSFTSVFSFLKLINLNGEQGRDVAEFVPYNISFVQTSVMQSDTGGIDNVISPSLPQPIPAASADPTQIWVAVLSLIWLAGVIVLLIYSVVSYVRIKRCLETATLIEGNVFETDVMDTAFVCGFICPKIYVPVDGGGADISYILEHERMHIRRKDYLIKPIAFFALILHWFNPLIWLSFALMSRDMEMSCDESVLNRLGEGAKEGYSSSLLALSVKRKRLLGANSLAFGESHVKARIKNTLNYKKPSFWVIIVAALAVCATTIACTANPKEPIDNDPSVYLGYPIDTLINNKTPYVGNNSKVIALIDAMPLPEGITRDTVELQTSVLPYGITINFNMSNASGIMVQGAISGDAFYRSSIILFSLIDNVDTINCRIIDKTNEYNGAI